MWRADKWKDYELIDCGGGRRLERWGKQILIRPDPQAVWPQGEHPLWSRADGIYRRSEKGGGGGGSGRLRARWADGSGEKTKQRRAVGF